MYRFKIYDGVVMKRVFFSTVLLLVFFIAGCSSKSISDEYANYRDQTSAQIFTKAEADMAKKHYSSAVEGFDALDAIYPFGPNSKQAQLDVIYAQYKNGDKPSALAAAGRYIRLYPRGQHTDYAYYMKGRIEFEQGFNWLQKKFKQDPAKSNLNDKKTAFTTFSTLIELYPHSRYVKDAQLRMMYLRDLFAQQELSTAQYYYDSKAYVAAANRATAVVEHYNKTPAVAQALVVLVKSYRQLNLDKQADNTLRILQASYPDTPELNALTQTT
jgi:outer membrane protein assembly factor BamD